MSVGSFRLLIVASMIVAGAGALDGILGGEWDLVAAFAAIVVLQLLLLATHLRHRRPVTLRVDLERWLRSRSELTGEDVERLLDRAVAQARADREAGP